MEVKFQSEPGVSYMSNAYVGTSREESGKEEKHSISSWNETESYTPSEEGLALTSQYVSATASVNATYDYRAMQTALHSLGFYNGQMDGNITSDASKNALRNFQKVYGLSQTGSVNNETSTILTAAKNSRDTLINSKEFKTIANSWGLDSSEKENFARTWSFLRVGMHMTSAATSGVMGNLYAESAFSSNCATGGGYNSAHVTNYTYNSKDNVAYGIAQWLNSDRKAGLKSTADSMGLATSDINAQLAFLRTEVGQSVFSDGWSNVKNSKDCRTAAGYFYSSYEMANDGTENKRKDYATFVYNNLSKM